MRDEINDHKVSFWNMFRLLVENEGEEGLTSNAIWSLMEDQVKKEGYDPKIIYLVGLNGTFARSILRAVNSRVLEGASIVKGYPDKTRYKATPKGAYLYLKFHRKQVEKRLQECKVA